MSPSPGFMHTFSRSNRKTFCLVVSSHRRSKLSIIIFFQNPTADIIMSTKERSRLFVLILFTFDILMHVLSLCICYWKASDRNRSQLCSGSSEKQVCLPVSANRESANVYEVTEVISGGNVCLVSQTHWSGLNKSMWCSTFFFLCLSVSLLVCRMFQYIRFSSALFCSRVHFMSKTWI